jgi:uncharacterized protein YqgQ
MHIKLYCIISFISACFCFKSVAQKIIPLKNENLVAYNRDIKITDSNGKAVVYLDAYANNGIAWIKDIKFDNGIIEFDVKGKDVMQQSFVGIAFHGMNDTSYDAVYFRPFNFNSPDTLRKKHAVQYISMPQYDFSVLRQNSTGIYENKLTSSIKAEDWFHARIVINKEEIKVFVNNNEQPCLNVKPLNNYTTGKIGFWVGNNSDGYFANLSIIQ